jgi:hypothetical protein
MKAFLVSVAVFCVWGILLSVLAYATGNLPTPAHLRPIAQQIDQDCSPCAENLAAVLDLVGQDWERDMALFFEQPQKPSKPAAHSWGGLSSAQREEAKQLFDQFGTEEGLRQLRESDPEAARQFEREQRTPPVRSEPDAPDSEESER